MYSANVLERLKKPEIRKIEIMKLCCGAQCHLCFVIKYTTVISVVFADYSKNLC